MLILAIIILLFIFQVYLAFRTPGVSLLLLPLSVIVFFVSANGFRSLFDIEVLSLSLSIVVMPVVLIITACQRVPLEKENPISKTIARFIALALLGIGLCFPLAFIWPVAILMVPVFIAFGVQCNKVSQYNMILYVISTIGSCMRQNLPLPMALSSAVSNDRNKRDIILSRISLWLTKGYSVSEAIRFGYSKCPTDILAMLTAAEKINRLPQTIYSIEKDLITKAEQNTQAERFSITYPVVVFSATFFITMGLMIFIIPTFATVMVDISDGAIRLPGPTKVLMEITDWLLGRNGLNAMLVLSPLIFIGIYSSLARVFKFRTDKQSLPFRLGDFFKWYFPPTNWFERNYALVQITSLVRNSLAAGLPIDRAIDGTLGLEMNYFFKKRLSMWHQSIQRGQNVSDSARRFRISDSIAWAFDDRVNKGNTPQILQMLEDFYRSIYNYRINIAKSIAMPLSIVALGLVVGFILYATFLPMVEIIIYLADTALP